MASVDSVVLLHDGPRLWLTKDDDGRLRAFRHPLPEDFTLDDLAYDWEQVFRFLPVELQIPVRATWPIADLPHGSAGRAVRVFAFETTLPAELPDPGGPLGRLADARLGRTTEYASDGRLGDPETLVALLAVAHDRLRHGGRGRGQ